MNKIISLTGAVILLFLFLAGCVEYSGYRDHDYPYGNSQGFDGSNYHGDRNYGYDQHGGHYDHDSDGYYR